MLSWQCKALTEEEKVAMIGSMRNASGNTRFASWLETWWSSEEQTTGTEGGEDLGATTAGNERLTEANDGRANDAGVDAAAVDGLDQNWITNFFGHHRSFFHIGHNAVATRYHRHL